MNNLNKPLVIAGHKIKNRICMPPLFCLGYSGNTEGIVSQKNISHYEKRAKAGTGLIVVEAACVKKNARLHPEQLGVWDDYHTEGLSKIASVCHKYGTVITVQLHHGGFNTHPDCGEPVSPSEWKGEYAKARTLSQEEIKDIHQAFVAGAVRVHKAGFDGVQLHGCHSYLLNAFSSALVNKRTDCYGGSAEKRTRLASDIIKDIKKACGETFIIDMRMAGNDPSPEIGIENAKHYIKAGIDMLSVSSGIGSTDDFDIPEGFPLNKIVWLGANIKSHFPQIPVSTGYKITTAEDAEVLIKYVDFVSSGRAMLADGNWSKSVLENTPIERPCIICKRCFWFSDPKKCPARKEAVE